MKGWLLLDVVVRERTTIFQLLASEDEALLVGWNSFFVLDFGLHIFNGVTRLHLEGDGFSSESLHEDLHLGFLGLCWLRNELFYAATYATTNWELALLLTHSGMRENDEAGLGGRNAQNNFSVSFPYCSDMESSST